MTLITPLGKDATEDEYLEYAHKLFLRVARELDRQLTQSDSCVGENASELAKLSSEARKAMVIIFEERKRLEQAGKKVGGKGGNIALDLANAREEINRRLACLQNASGS